MKNKLLMLIMSSTLVLTSCGGGVSATDLRNDYLNREKIKQTADDVYTNTKDAAKVAKDQAIDAAEDVRDAATDKAGEVKEGARDAADAAAESAKETASDAAGAVKDAAMEQAEDTRQDAEHVGGLLSSEWHKFLDELMSPTGLKEATDELLDVTDENTGGSGKNESQTTDTDGTDGEGAMGRAPSSVKFPPIEANSIPPYSGSTVVEVNSNSPFFTDEDLTMEAFELYSPLDSLGRCQSAYANICADIMPTAPRGEIGMIKPTGWVQKKYEGVIDEDPPYLYNRCHLIAFSLAGENANPKNLITGTRHFNIETGMEEYELKVLSYVKRTGHHVLYRVTPVFEGDNLLATGVLMEGQSVEDNEISFCVFVYNVQPGVEIDYKTGDSHLA